MPRKPKLMISYCHVNKSEARRLHERLDSSFEILIDENYFELSRSTKPEMKRMVGDADVVLVLLSPVSVASKAVRYEVKCALERESEEQRKILFAAMIEACEPMPEWDSRRLYANLHSAFSTEFTKLKRNLSSAARKALPRATAVPDSESLIDLARISTKSAGFEIRGDVEINSRGTDLPDNPLSARLLNVDGHRFFSTFIATFGKWTCFFYIPKQAIAGKTERLFAFERFSLRSQVAARFGGYLANGHRRPNLPEIEGYIKLFRRFPKQIDVIVSPYSVANSYIKKFDVKMLSWAGTKAALFYKTNPQYAGVASLPVFIAPAITNQEMLADALRALKSALRLELKSHGAAEERWGFLQKGSFGSRPRSGDWSGSPRQ
jgi:hypothetical protein